LLSGILKIYFVEFFEGKCYHNMVTFTYMNRWMIFIEGSHMEKVERKASVILFVLCTMVIMLITNIM